MTSLGSTKYQADPAFYTSPRYRMFRKWRWQSLAALARDFEVATEQRLSAVAPRDTNT
jgi:hypothetical protein